MSGVTSGTTSGQTGRAPERAGRARRARIRRSRTGAWEGVVVWAPPPLGTAEGIEWQVGLLVGGGARRRHVQRDLEEWRQARTRREQAE